MQILKPTSGRVSSQGVATFRVNGTAYIPSRDGVNISIIEAKFKTPNVTTYKLTRYDCDNDKETRKRYVTVKTLSQMS